MSAYLICNGEWNLGRLTRFSRQFDKKLRRMAEEIIVTQRQEIAAMRLAVGEPLPAQAPSPTSESRQRTSVQSLGSNNNPISAEEL